jgi:hypothetical protein
MLTYALSFKFLVPLFVKKRFLYEIGDIIFVRVIRLQKNN